MTTLGIGVAVHGLVIIVEPRDIAHVLRIITRKREPSLLTSQVEKSYSEFEVVSSQKIDRYALQFDLLSLSLLMVHLFPFFRSSNSSSNLDNWRLINRLGSTRDKTKASADKDR